MSALPTDPSIQDRITRKDIHDGIALRWRQYQHSQVSRQKTSPSGYRSWIWSFARSGAALQCCIRIRSDGDGSECRRSRINGCCGLPAHPLPLPRESWPFWIRLPHQEGGGDKKVVTILVSWDCFCLIISTENLNGLNCRFLVDRGASDNFVASSFLDRFGGKTRLSLKA